MPGKIKKQRDFIQVLILIALINVGILSVVPTFVFATSGACSWHGGVNCAAGTDWDGSVICNDGWKDSTVDYFSMSECSAAIQCTVSELESLQQKYGIKELFAEIQSTSKEMSNLSEQLNAIGEQERQSLLTIQGQAIPMENISGQQKAAMREFAIQKMEIAGKMQAKATYSESLRSSLTLVNQQIDSECKVLGYNRQQQQMLDYINNQQALLENQQKQDEERLAELNKLLEQSKVSSCPTNSSYNEPTKECRCNSGYFIFENSGQCALGQNWCHSKYGTFTNFNVEKRTCECMNGHTFNGSSCVEINCPLNSSWKGTSCTCNNGFTVQNGQCIKIEVKPTITPQQSTKQKVEEVTPPKIVEVEEVTRTKEVKNEKLPLDPQKQVIEKKSSQDTIASSTNIEKQKQHSKQGFLSKTFSSAKSLFSRIFKR